MDFTDFPWRDGNSPPHETPKPSWGSMQVTYNNDFSKVQNLGLTWQVIDGPSSNEGIVDPTATSTRAHSIGSPVEARRGKLFTRTLTLYGLEEYAWGANRYGSTRNLVATETAWHRLPGSAQGLSPVCCCAEPSVQIL